MELFKLVCTTCATRLKVGQLSAIGQILACPKCGSMVKVEPPPGWQPPASQSKPKAPASAARPVDPNLPETKSVVDFEDIDGLLSNEMPPPTGTGTSFVGGPRSNQTVNPASAREKILPTDRATMSTAARERKRALALMVGIATLVVVAFALIFALASMMMQRSNTPVADENRGDASSNTAPEIPADEKGVQTNPAVAGDDSTHPNSIENENVAVAIPPPPRLKVPPFPESAAIADATQPPGFESPPRNPTDRSTGIRLIDDFGSLNEFLQSGNESFSLRDLEDAAMADRGQIGIGTLFIRKSDYEPIELNKRLNDPLAGIRFDQVPLIVALRTLSQMSTIPLTVDADLVAANGIDLMSPVTIDANGVTVQKVLTDILEPAGLAAYELDAQLAISVRDRDAPIRREYDLGIFAGDTGELSKNFDRFVRTTFAPNSWDSMGGNGTLEFNASTAVVTNSPAVQQLVDRLFRQLSAAKQLMADPGNETARRQIRSRHQAAQQTLQTSVVLGLLGEQPMEYVLTRIAQDFGPVILVDWQALTAEGWSPSVEIPWPEHAATLREQLSELVASMHVAYRIVDERTLEISTLDELRNKLEIEVYPCGEALKKFRPDQLQAWLERALADQVNSTDGMSISFEPSTQCIVAYLPQRLQIRLEATLNELSKPQ